MNITWNAENYRENFQFVHKYGEDVLNLLSCSPGSLVVDLGCGNGALSRKLVDRGYRVLGIDASEEMLKLARSQYPELDFIQEDACTFQLSQKADAVFSNAVLHWIDRDRQEMLLRNVAAQLKQGGQFVCEFGGKGCAETVHAALERNFAKQGLVYPRTFYFPTIGEYAPILERCGFRVEYAVLFDRPTEQKHESGLREWIDMFVRLPFEGMDEKLKRTIVDAAEREVKDTLFCDGRWYIDYVRIRLKAVKMQHINTAQAHEDE